ncbi:hypothetical protein IGJ55_002931 [Enterococcus sp. AZ170]|nr:WxL domain-containing protein [Enterococcus ureilyticus]
MKNIRLFVFLILFLGVGSFQQVNAVESQTNSQVGIKFIEGDKTKDSDTSESKDPPIKGGNDDSILKSQKANSFPKTGESAPSMLLFIIGSLFIIFALTFYLKKGGKKVKRKEKIITGLILFGSMSVFAPSMASAAPADGIQGTETGKGATSYGTLKLEANTEGVVPPIKPSEPSGETGNTGALTIDNVSPLLFGEHKIDGGKAEFSTETVAPNVQVSDRRGEGQGWNLQVRMSEFADKTDDTKILKGAELSIPAGTVGKSEGNIALPPETKDVVIAGSIDSAQTIFSAKEKTGLGTWTNEFDASQVKLMVPAGNLKGDYQATMTWSLLDAPK